MNGIAVECRRKDGSIGTEIVRLVDFENPDANDWLVVNQFTVIEGQHRGEIGARLLAFLVSPIWHFF